MTNTKTLYSSEVDRLEIDVWPDEPRTVDLSIGWVEGGTVYLTVDEARTLQGKLAEAIFWARTGGVVGTSP